MNRIFAHIDWLYNRHPIIFGALLAFLIIGANSVANLLVPPP